MCYPFEKYLRIPHIYIYICIIHKYKGIFATAIYMLSIERITYIESGATLIWDLSGIYAHK